MNLPKSIFPYALLLVPVLVIIGLVIVVTTPRSPEVEVVKDDPQPIRMLSPSVDVPAGLAERVKEQLEQQDIDFYVFAITDVASQPPNLIVSVAGFDPDADENWTLGDALWLGTVTIPDDGEVTVQPLVYGPHQDEEYIEYGGPPNIFPWRNGTQARYGLLGIHSCGYGLNGWWAVDFFPQEENMVYATQGGDVDYVCRDSIQVAVKVGQNLYAHLEDTGQQVGMYYQQGQAMAAMVPGTFTGKCGNTDQQPENYHVHFCFTPNPGGAWFADGWGINIANGKWSDGVSEVSPGGYLTANWAIAGPGDSGDPGQNIPGPVAGSNFWDSLTGGVIGLVKKLVPVLPDHEAMGLADRVLSVAVVALHVVYVILLTNFDMTVPAWALGIWFAVEAVRIIVAGIRWIGKLIDVIPVIG